MIQINVLIICILIVMSLFKIVMSVNYLMTSINIFEFIESFTNVIVYIIVDIYIFNVS